MNREDCSLRQKVYFGRKHGEKTLGEVVSIAGKTAKVKQLESRGTMKDHRIGTIWTVPFNLLAAAPNDAKPGDEVQATPPEKIVIHYNPFDDNNDLYECLAGVYNQLSPENLTCDGELSRARVAEKSRVLQRKLRGLILAIGFEADETTIMNWEIERRDYERAKQSKFTSAEIVTPEGLPATAIAPPGVPLTFQPGFHHAKPWPKN